jgi:hypothetical protein
MSATQAATSCSLGSCQKSAGVAFSRVIVQTPSPDGTSAHVSSRLACRRMDGLYVHRGRRQKRRPGFL